MSCSDLKSWDIFHFKLAVFGKKKLLVDPL